MKLRFYILLGMLALMNISPAHPHSRKPTIYFDRILRDLIPESLNTCYYQTLKDRHYTRQYAINFSQTDRRPLVVAIYTKPAKSGYLKINKAVTAYIDSSQMDTSRLQLVYIVDGQRVETCKEVRQLVALKTCDIDTIQCIPKTEGTNIVLHIIVTTKQKRSNSVAFSRNVLTSH